MYGREQGGLELTEKRTYPDLLARMTRDTTTILTSTPAGPALLVAAIRGGAVPLQALLHTRQAIAHFHNT